MKSGVSITRRLMLAVLLLEFLAALVLIATVTNHERRVQFETFDANLRATSNALLGAVQEADSKDGSIALDTQGVSLSSRAAYRVTADNGQVLAERGNVPSLPLDSGTVFPTRIQDHPFRFYVLKGDRIIDPNSPRSVNHKVTVVYGLPEGRTWHSIFEATRFFIYATLILLGITAVVLSWLIRCSLLPIRELAQEAEKVDAERWAFEAPASSQQFHELRPLASAIEKTLARLQRSFEQQRRFTSDAAHELKTDLAIAKSSLQLLAMRRRTAEEYERGLDVGLEDIARLEATVQKMLALARLEQSPKEGSHESDFAQALRNAIAQCQSYADLRKVTFVLSDLPSSTKIKLNAEDALLLCSNVLVNAIQHSPKDKQIAISLTVHSPWTELRIRDHGDGIADSDLPHLFDAFYRSDVSRSRNTGGTGLGLSICKAICVRAGGRISIANHSSGGAEVVILLPILVTKSGIN